jgi:hypothetical protein
MLGEVETIVRAAGEHGAACLATAYKETSSGKTAPRGSFNAWGIGPGERFGSWAEGAADYARRLSTVAEPYTPAGITVREFHQTYVGGPECRRTNYGHCANGENRQTIELAISQFCDRINAWRAMGGGEEPKTDPWRPYPYPKMVDLIVPKPRDGAGFDRVAFRRPHIRGFCTHITDGPQTQSIEFFRDFFGTGGARAYDALTDLVIGADGRIGLLNDWRDPERGGTRAGWANGGTDGLEGDGLAFYRRFPAINSALVSCEHASKAGQAWTDAMIEATVEVRTAIAQELRCPAASYPVHPAWGVSIEQQHRNFATKNCPAEPYISRHAPVVLREVKAKLAAWQGGDVDIPPPAPVRTFTDFGFTEEQVAYWFGTMRRHNADGTVDDLPFDPTGPLSLLWLKRCEERNVWPEAEEMKQFDSRIAEGKEWFASWEGGWTAVAPVGDGRAGWRWLDEIGEAA